MEAHLLGSLGQRHAAAPTHTLLAKAALPEEQEVERHAAGVARELRCAEAALANLEKAAEAAIVTAHAHAATARLVRP